uniref:Uncharacterized protein n=1 Tax=Rhizophora mucronata TaxID=61149 RepID=A0A2P2J5Z0_RHIMU
MNKFQFFSKLARTSPKWWARERTKKKTVNPSQTAASGFNLTPVKCKWLLAKCKL